MGTKEKACIPLIQTLAASGTVPTLQITSLWLWGHHLCKIKYGLDTSLCHSLFRGSVWSQTRTQQQQLVPLSSDVLSEHKHPQTGKNMGEMGSQWISVIPMEKW